MTCDILDQIGFPQDVDAKCRRTNVPSGVVPANLKPQPLEDALDVGIADLQSEHALNALPAQFDLSRGHWDGIFVDRAAARRSCANVLEKRDGPLDALHRRVDVGTPFEPRRCLRLEPQLPARAANALRIEKRAFEHDGFSSVAHFRPAAAHHARNRLRLVAVGYHQHLRIERAIDAVERCDALAGCRPANPDFLSREPLEVERMHRLSELEQDVVCDVDDVVDGTHTGGLQS